MRYAGIVADVAGSVMLYRDKIRYGSRPLLDVCMQLCNLQQYFK